MRSIFAWALVLIFLSLGCSGSSGGSASGTITLHATDAALNHAMVAEAVIRVDTIRIHPEADSEDGFLTIYDGAPVAFDLLDLRNGVTEALVSAEVPAADYRQIRLHVESAYLRLVNGNEYDTSDGSLKLTSQATSGFKVFLSPPVTVVSGFSTDLLLDFELDKTFKPTPANDPLNANTFKFHPVIRAANLSMTGEIRGVVTEDDGLGGLLGVSDATVYIFPPGETDPANAIASTATGDEGGYAILGIPPGSNDVYAAKESLEGRLDAVTVFAGSASVADVTIQ